MYKDSNQLRIKDFVFPYGKLDPENDWVRLAALVPWDVAEERYAARFVNNGHPAHPARMALGALLIQRRLKCSDQWLVKHIGENPYLQYFIGMKEYGPCPFGASTLVAFRKRFSEKDLAVILEATVPKREAEEKDDADDGNDSPNSGTLILDATCCPADIAYPQDINLLNQAREKAEKTVDELCEMAGQKKPRMYRKRARKDYLRLSKSKKRSGSAIRSAIRKQLQYIRRDIGCVAELVQKGAKLTSKQAERLNIVATVYEQWTAAPELNAWISNHSTNRKVSGGRWPGTRSAMDVIQNAFWRTSSIATARHWPFVKSMGFVCPVPALGKPPKNPLLSRQTKKQEYLDCCDRNAVEGIFGTGKTAYGLARISAHLQETAVCVIGVALLLLNLSRSLRSAFALFCLLSVVAILPGLRSRA